MIFEITSIDQKIATPANATLTLVAHPSMVSVAHFSRATKRVLEHNSARAVAEADIAGAPMTIVKGQIATQGLVTRS
jgi:hypothetical protein